jgi:hypothetical protein
VFGVEVLAAQRWQNSAVLTYSENGAGFPIMEWAAIVLDKRKNVLRSPKGFTKLAQI